MTARSRLGRDPLSGVTQPETKKTTKPATKSTAKKAPPKKAGTPKPTKAGAASPKAAPMQQQPSPTAQSAPEKIPVEPRPIPESVLVPDTPPEIVVAAASDTEIQPVPQSTPMIEATTDVAVSEATPETPMTAPVVPAGPTIEVSQPAMQRTAAVAPTARADDETPAGMTATAAVETVAPTEPAAKAIQPIPQSTPVVEPARQAVVSESPCPPLPTDGPHPAEVFLRGVLEGLAPAGGLLTDVEVDPDTSTLPVEKLFYFSHVLQLLVSPQERPSEPGRKPGDKRGPVPALSVRLRTIGPNRHSLRIYDNGLFFGRYLPDVSLNMEALRPLLLFVIKRDGSILLKQGKGIEFEIIG